MENLRVVLFLVTLTFGMITIGVKSDDGGTYDDDHYNIIKIKRKHNHASSRLDGLLLQSAAASDGSGVFDVTKFGAKGDGKTDNTKVS